MRWLLVLLGALLIAAVAWQLVGREELESPSSLPTPGAAPVDEPAPVQGAPAAPRDVRPATPLVPATKLEPAPAPIAGPGAQFLVVDEAGTPIAGATVQAVSGEHDLASVRTGPDGHATLRDVPEDAGHVVRAPGRWPVIGAGCVRAATTRVVLPVAPKLEGRVFDAAGLALANARAAFVPAVEGRLAPPPSPPPATHAAASDAQGAFTIAWPDAGAYDLVVTAAGHAPSVLPALRANVQGGAPVIVQMLAGASVTGVAKYGDGRPMVGARVEVWSTGDRARGAAALLGPQQPWRAGEPLAVATTQAGGEFTVAELPSLPAVVTLAADVGVAAAHVTLLAGLTPVVELVAAAPALVHGTIPGAAIEQEVFLYGGPRFVRTVRATNGTFAFDAVPAGRYLIGAAMPPIAEHLHAVVQELVLNGVSTLAMTIDLLPGEQRNIALAPAARIVGGVAGIAFVAGAPAADHVVALEAAGGAGAQRREAPVGTDGSFRIDGVPPGDYDARLRRRGHAAVLCEVRCRVQNGQTVSVTLAGP